MSQLISDLLGATEPIFSLALRQLEQDSGNPAADIRLTAEIVGKVRLKTKELGLDPDDTTGTELYHALLNRVRQDDEQLAKTLGAQSPDDVQTLLPLIKKRIEALDIPRGCWALKKSVAKKMLKKMPPRAIMKHLGYRSIDSMLKRENIYEIYGALRFAESPAWLNQFNELYKTLKPTDFENRTIEIVQMPSERWGDIAVPFIHKKRHNITHVKELGVILMLPITMTKLQGVCITVMPLLLHYVNEIRLYSAFFKLQQVKPDFGTIIVTTLTADPSTAAVMCGQNVHWRVIQRYFGKLESESHPEIFEPHVQPEDLHWRKAEEVLYRVEPCLEFWRDMDYVGVMYGNRPVVFNLMDMAMAYCNRTPYAYRVMFHFRESLWNEVFMRYMSQKTLENQVLKQLNNNLIAPEDL